MDSAITMQDNKTFKSRASVVVIHVLGVPHAHVLLILLSVTGWRVCEAGRDM